MNKVRTRFAPSPTGYLHIGGLRTALYAWLFAKKNNGDFILRIEDTDLERYVEGASELIYFTLKDSGLVYSEGPDVGGDFGPYIQSERRNTYRQHAEDLIKRGGAYRCFCTKERLAELKSEDGLAKYDKKCLHLTQKEIQAKLDAGEPYVIRQNIPETGVASYVDLVYGEIKVDNKELEDNILIKTDGMPTYNFANVVDDHLMQINYVIRGIEYLSSTPKYNLLYDGLGWERPNYIHLPPVMRDERNKLSKRHGDPSYNDLIKEGFLKEALINYIALLGWSPKDNREKFTLEELTELFSTDGLSKSPAIFDKAKLRWLNGEYIKELTLEDFHDFALPYYLKSVAKDKYDYAKLSKLLHHRTEVFSDIPQLLSFLEDFKEFSSSLYDRQKLKATSALAKEILPKVLKEMQELKNFDETNISALFERVALENGYKKGQVLWSVRVALTGKEATPGGATEMADLIGKERTIERLTKSIGFLAE